MGYKSLEHCVNDLEKHGHLIRIKEEVDPNLEMAAIHLKIHKAGGPAIFFENIKGSPFKAVSNLFGTIERSKFIFRDTISKIEKLIELKTNPGNALKHPFNYLDVLPSVISSIPKKTSFHSFLFQETSISSLPQIKCWPDDGGAFITLPIVYTEDIEHPGIQHSNIGMYRIQISGNDYVKDKEIGLHYQLHRGIGIHQTKANAKGQPLKVSIFIGGPPSHSFGAVMPLPEGMPELNFAGALGNKRFSYSIHEGHVISNDADFIITGEVYPNENKLEGPFGDHLGYYSLKHDFPVMRVHKVFHKKNAIWPFTVVGRPPQEDTSFGKLIHELTGKALLSEIPGVHEIHAVDAAGVHPLLLAIGSERYTPYIADKKPQELLTIANHILGTGQLSLAKFLFIINGADAPSLSAKNIQQFFIHLLERIDWKRDLHFYTNFTVDTLDYSGTGLNSGSKVVVAASGNKIRELGNSLPKIDLPSRFSDPKIIFPGALVITAPPYQTNSNDVEKLKKELESSQLENSFPLIVLADDSNFCIMELNNFLWVTFTRSNPSHDIHGVNEFTDNKHWGCKGPLVIDARVKPHHAPELKMNQDIEKRANLIIKKYL